MFMMKALVGVLLLLCVGSELAETKNLERVDYNGEAVDFFSGREGVEARLEETPSEDATEGDMLLNSNQSRVYEMMMQEMTTEEDRMRLEAEVNSAFKYWPRSTFVYKFHDALSDGMKALFKEAVEIYKQDTCITFEEAQDGYSGDIPPILIIGNDKGKQCSASVGGPGGQISLLEGVCKYKGIVLHEIAHALGFFHEQNRSDRDDYITVNTDNIRQGYEHNFKKMETAIRILGMYDLQSILHYSPTAFSKDGRQKTLEPKSERMEPKMGRQKMLSRLDILKFNKAYNCYDKCSAEVMESCENGGLPSKDCTCMCPDVYQGAHCTILKDIPGAAEDCTKEYTEPSGEIATPQYPNKYPANTECVYAIKCPKTQKVSVTFEDFQVEGWGCLYDKFGMTFGKIVDEMYPDNYCGSALKGKTITSETNLVIMKFHSDRAWQYKGIKLQYQCVDA